MTWICGSLGTSLDADGEVSAVGCPHPEHPEAWGFSARCGSGKSRDTAWDEGSELKVGDGTFGRGRF